MSPLDRWKMIYGFSLIGILAVLAAMFGLGRVESNSSYGLMPLVVALASALTQFGGWAFGHRSDDRAQDKTQKDDQS